MSGEVCVSEMLFCGKSHLFSSGAIVQFNVPLDVFFWKALAFLVSFCQSFLCYVHIYWLHFLTSLTHFAQAFISIALSKVTKGLSLAKSKGQFLLPLTWLFNNTWHRRPLWTLALLDSEGLQPLGFLSISLATFSKPLLLPPLNTALYLIWMLGLLCLHPLPRQSHPASRFKHRLCAGDFKSPLCLAPDTLLTA